MTSKKVAPELEREHFSAEFNEQALLRAVKDGGRGASTEFATKFRVDRGGQQ